MYYNLVITTGSASQVLAEVIPSAALIKYFGGPALHWHIVGSERDMVSLSWNSGKRQRLTNCRHKITTGPGAGRKCKWD